jgi:CHAT domain
MKILYIAANPYDQKELDFGPEVTEIQRRVSSAASVEFVAMPSLKFEDLASTLHQHQPDILHIAAHGDEKKLFLANYDNNSIHIDAEMLATFFSDKSPPRVVYLNACNSLEIAKELTRVVPMAIGSTAPISAKTGRATAVSFYERILDGSSVTRAVRVCEQVMRGSSGDQARMKLFNQQGIDPSAQVLYTGPRFVAEFVKEKPKRNAKGDYEIRFGIFGCPHTTRQIIFFSDDPESISEDDSLENDLCTVVREPPRRGLVMMEKDDAWDIEGDYRLYAVGVYGDGRAFTLTTMLCEALEERYRLSHGSARAEVAAAIADLRSTDGSQLL